MPMGEMCNCETNQSGETLLQSQGDQERPQGLGTAGQGVGSTSSVLHPQLDAGETQRQVRKRLRRLMPFLLQCLLK